jgi:hypothetical protein
MGGFGKVRGLVLSLIFLQLIPTGFNLLGLSLHLTQAIWGAILIFVIAIAGRPDSGLRGPEEPCTQRLVNDFYIIDSRNSPGNYAFLKKAVDRIADFDGKYLYGCT